MSTIDYLPIANGGSANVESQAQYVIDLAGGGSLENGYEAGLAKSVQFNKTMRQSSMIAAAIATFISQQLGISVLDDGVLSTLVTNLTNAVRTANQAGQCRLSVTSTTALKLSPFGGNHLTINGVSQVIPAAGVSVSNGGLAASTNYYIYAFMSAGVMTLEASATGHSTDVATAGNIGVEIKTGDPTRTLVGLVRTDASVHFIDAPTQRFCLSWFNRRIKSVAGTPINNPATASLVAVEADPSTRAEFLIWSDGLSMSVGVMSTSANSGAGNALNHNLCIDGVAGANVILGGQQQVIAPFANQNCAMGSGCGYTVPAEGYHYLTLAIYVSGGTGTWTGNGFSTVGGALFG